MKTWLINQISCCFFLIVLVLINLSLVKCFHISHEFFDLECWSDLDICWRFESINIHQVMFLLTDPEFWAQRQNKLPGEVDKSKNCPGSIDADLHVPPLVGARLHEVSAEVNESAKSEHSWHHCVDDQCPGLRLCDVSIIQSDNALSHDEEAEDCPEKVDDKTILGDDLDKLWCNVVLQVVLPRLVLQWCVKEAEDLVDDTIVLKEDSKNEADCSDVCQEEPHGNHRDPL